MELLAGPEALIPRVELILASAALTIAKSIADAQGVATILDICTGSGNVALAIASNEPRSRVLGQTFLKKQLNLREKMHSI